MNKQSASHRLIEGRNPCVEAIKAGTVIHEILLEEHIGRDEKINFITHFAQTKKIPLKKVPRRFLERFSRTGVHQGVMMKADSLPLFSVNKILQDCDKNGKPPFFVIVTEILYQYNLGALLRSALAAKVDAVVVPKHTQEAGPVTARAAMGAIEYIPLIYDNIFVVLKQLKNEGIKTVAAFEKGTVKYYDADLRLPLAIVIGGEDKGISSTIAARVDELVSIPMNDKVPSLNLSVAAGIMLFEARRQNDV